ncbi:MAG: hypothetical protein ABFC18_03085 [Rikenellaceae bacterium]
MANVELTIKVENTQAVKNIQDIQKATENMQNKAQQGMQREKGLIEDVEDSLKKYQESKKKAFTVEEIEKLNRKIQEAKIHLEEYEKAGVKANDNIKKTTDTVVGSLTKWAMGIASLGKLFGELIKTFKDTVAGINMMTQAGEVYKQTLYNIISGQSMFSTSLAQSLAVGKQLNTLRQEERKSLVSVAKAETEYFKLYFEASDRTKTDIERLNLLNQAEAKHKEIIDEQSDILYKRLAIVEQQLLLRPKSTELINEEVKLKVELENVEKRRYSETRRLEGLRSGLAVKTMEAEGETVEEYYKLWTDYYKWYQDQIDQTIKAEQKARDDAYKFEMDYANKLFKANKDLGKDEWERLQEMEKERTKATEDAEDRRREALKESYNMMIEAEQMIFQIASNNLESRYTRELDLLDAKTESELQKAGDNEKKRQQILERSEYQKSEIDKKYRKEQQQLDIKQAVIDGAMAIVKTYAKFGWPAGILPAAMMAAVTALQVGVIKSQKFAVGGWTGKGMGKDDTGERIAGIVHGEEFVIRRGPAEKYKGLLEAINRDQSNIFSSFNFRSLKGSTVNNIIVENSGSNTRLDKVIAEQKAMNRKLGTQIITQGGRRIITHGNKTRIIG